MAARSLEPETITGGGKAWQWNNGKPLVLEHAEERPVIFESQKQLRSYMKAKGWESSALL